jgi:uncharacterized protein (TIGR03435 family)
LWTCRAVSETTLILSAYSLQPYELIPPGSLDNRRFDIAAKVPPGTNKLQLHLMQQDLLESQFHLRTHHALKEMPVYELTVDRNGLKIRQSTTAPEEPPDETDLPPSHAQFDQMLAARKRSATVDRDGFPVPQKGQPGFTVVNGRAGFNATGFTMQQFVKFLTGQLDRPLIDATGLKGRYQMQMHWTQDWARSSPENPAPGPTLIRSIQDQLGLKVEPKKARVEVLVVDP